jgi:hypothetical protein
MLPKPYKTTSFGLISKADLAPLSLLKTKASTLLSFSAWTHSLI